MSRFEERHGTVIEGTVVRVLPVVIETVRDAHIELAVTPAEPPTERVIVEVTP